MKSIRNRISTIASLALAFAITAACTSALAEEPPPLAASAGVTPDEWLKAQVPPSFRPGYTLPRLTRFGWIMTVPTRIELTERWGYALEFAQYADAATVAALDKPDSDLAKLLALAKSDPKRYPSMVLVTGRMPYKDVPPETWARDKDGAMLSGEAKSLDGNAWSREGAGVYSPETPDAVWQQAGAMRADPVRELVKRGLPLKIIINGGECGLGILGFARKPWSQDPRIVAAVQGQWKGAWEEYASAKKGHAERIIADAVRQAVPERDLYVYYTAGGGTMRNSWWGIKEWAPQWKHLRGVSDIPSNEIYYLAYNDGFTGAKDMLTLALNATANEIASGDPLSYNYICAGWARGDAKKYHADLNRWTGFLKCYYTAGMIGANVGYYELPKGGFDARFPADQPPPWLQQMVATSHVHALFSQVEDIVRHGELLPGPMHHTLSTSDPAYEFPTGDANARVLVRKHRQQPAWLITAWVAEGADRPAQVFIPELGVITVSARVRECVSRDVETKHRHAYAARSRGRDLHRSENRARRDTSRELHHPSADHGGPAPVAVGGSWHHQGRCRESLRLAKRQPQRVRICPARRGEAPGVEGGRHPRTSSAAI